MFINDNPKVYSIVNPKKNNPKTKNTPIPNVDYKEGVFTEGVGSFSGKPILDNISHYDFKGEDYIYDFENHYYIVKCSLPFNKLKNGSRNKVLSIFLNNLLILNPNMGFKNVIGFMQYVNINKCIEPLKENEIKNMVNYAFRNKAELKPYYTKRSILFNPNGSLLGKQKPKATFQINNEYRKLKSQQIINVAIEEWNYQELGKITQTKLAEVTKLDIKTVQRYWRIFKGFVKDLNTEFKLSKIKNTYEDPVHKIIQLEAEQLYADQCYMEYMDEVTSGYEWYELVA